jgi:hypothetical protein
MRFSGGKRSTTVQGSQDELINKRRDSKAVQWFSEAFALNLLVPSPLQISTHLAERSYSR